MINQPSSRVTLLAVALALLCSMAAAADWTYGRATFYDDNTQGSCHYYQDIPEWYAAWPDSQEGFPNCGNCFEVQCRDIDFTDGYGTHVQRSNACYDKSKTVTVKIVDSCPCVHANFFSNQRWCCGDMKHIDLGRKAFKELAAEHLGVIGLKWRKVSCDKLGVGSSSTSQAAPARPAAQTPSKPSRSSQSSSSQSSPSKPSGGSRKNDKFDRKAWGDMWANAWMGKWN